MGGSRHSESELTPRSNSAISTGSAPSSLHGNLTPTRYNSSVNGQAPHSPTGSGSAPVATSSAVNAAATAALNQLIHGSSSGGGGANLLRHFPTNSENLSPEVTSHLQAQFTSMPMTMPPPPPPPFMPPPPPNLANLVMRGPPPPGHHRLNAPGFVVPPLSNPIVSPSQVMSSASSFRPSPMARTESNGVSTATPPANGGFVAGGSSANPSSNTPRSGSERPGTRLIGDEVAYAPNSSQSQSQNDNTQSLEVTPITLYQSERVSELGNLISVNDHFISYPIRNGLVRVISQSSVSRTLLRDHEEHLVQEMAFFDASTDLLLSFGTDNRIVIREILENYDKPMTKEITKILHTSAQRVKWHPLDSQVIGIVNGNVVFVTDLQSVSATGEGSENLYDISLVCDQSSSQINDIAFEPNGESLVTAGSDGFVHVYRIVGCANGGPAEFIQRFEPFDGEVVNSLHFFEGNFVTKQGLMVGGERNTRLSLWNLPLTEAITPKCYQSVKLLGQNPDTETSSCEPAMHETLFDTNNQFLFVADRSRPLIYVLHLAPSANSRSPRRFDNVTEFTVAYPILSMNIINSPSQTTRAATDDAEDMAASAATGRESLEFAMQLYCIQTKAIQRYHVEASACYAPSCSLLSADGVIPSDEAGKSLGQTVGAMTTEGKNVEISYQSASESPRATVASPETEIDVQISPSSGEGADNEDDNDGGDYPATLSPSSSRATAGAGTSLNLGQEDTSSMTGDTAGGSLRSFVRSSPSSSVIAYQDEASQQYEPSIDDVTSESSQQAILSYLRRIEAAQTQRDEQFREQMRTFLGTLGNHLSAQVATQVDKSIQKQMQTVLVPAMGRIVLHTMENNFMKPVQTGFQRVITEKLLPVIETKVNESLSNSLPEQLDNGVNDMVQKVVEDVRQPVRESFRECFQDIIIPSFQAATQKMFEQINDTFVQGTRKAIEANESGKPHSNAQQMQQLIEMVEDLSRKVDSLQRGVPTGQPASASDSREASQVEAQKQAVLEFLAKENYEEAFKLALGAQNVDLVTFTCHQCESRVVLMGRPPKLSQLLVLCLVQQLGADLLNDTSTKLSWLRDSLLVMDVKDDTIASFVAGVLKDLQTSLNEVATPTDARDAKQHMLVHHILNSMLSAV